MTARSNTFPGAAVMKRRFIATLLAALPLVWLTTSQNVHAQKSEDKFPNRAINIVVTFPPGGGTDILARLIGNYLTDVSGYAGVVENKPGASGNLGAKFVAEHAPDGYTLLMVNSSYAINPAVFANMPFDPKKDLVPIINVAYVPSVLVVPASSPYNTLNDLLNAARPNKNDISYGSCGNGTPQHLAGESLNIAAKTHMTHIPFSGCGPALNSVLGNQIPLAIITASSANAQIKAGKLRALAVTSPQRSPYFAEVPTVAELGFPGYQLNQWHGLLAPAGISASVKQKIYEDVNKVMQRPDVIEKLKTLGYTQANDDPDAFKKIVDGDIDKFSKLSKDIGLRVD